MGRYTDIKLEKLGKFLKHLEIQEPKDDKLIQAVKDQMEFYEQQEPSNTG